MSEYAITAFVLAALCLYLGTRKRRNRRVGLPPPSHLCIRNSTEAVP